MIGGDFKTSVIHRWKVVLGRWFKNPQQLDIDMQTLQKLRNEKKSERE
jgi:hypothetical protein